MELSKTTTLKLGINFPSQFSQLPFLIFYRQRETVAKAG